MADSRPEPASSHRDRAEYLRTLRSVRENLTVGDAEDVVAQAWLALLDAARTEALCLIQTLGSVGSAARAEVRAAQRTGGSALARAQRRLEAAEQAQDRHETAARSLLTHIDAQIDRARKGVVGRQARRRAEVERLRRAALAVRDWGTAAEPEG